MESSPFDQPRSGRSSRTMANSLFDSPGLHRRGNLFGNARAAASPRTRQNAAAPSYDFLAPASSPVPSRQRSSAPKAVNNQSNELLRAELNSVRYELSTLRDERELEKIRHEQDIRALETKVQEQGKRADAVETDKRFLFEKQKELSEKLEKVKDQATNHKQDLERQIRRLQTENTNLKESVTDKEDDIQSQERQHRRQLNELETRNKALNRTNEEMSGDLENRSAALQEVQYKLAEKEAEVGTLETELLRVKAQTGDLETLKILKKELSEQVSHMKTLESTNRRQQNELKQLREFSKSLELVEEEKAALEQKVRMMDDLRRELSESQLQVSILQNERNSWNSYFVSEGLEFDSPESLARALITERVEKATLLEKAGRTSPELAEKENVIESLETELGGLKTEVQKLREAGTKDAKSKQRLERQRALALKEAQFLREQLKSFSAEETIHMDGNFDQHKSKRIEELEGMLEGYKKENEQLLAEVIKKEGGAQVVGAKRQRDEDEDERLGQLTRKNRQFQDEIGQLQQSISVSQKELQAAHVRIASLESTSTRILQLQDNPTSQEEAIKASTLKSLRQENAALLALLDGQTDKVGRMVPISTLENARKDIKSMEKLVAEKEKRMTRLKEIWSAKSMEFREAVYSLLGYKLDFMPNGRVRVTHMFAGRGEDQSIEFDGEKGTMRVSGGPNSLFQKEIKNQCSFWMARQSIPCLLASILIEQYEKTTRAQVM